MKLHQFLATLKEAKKPYRIVTGNQSGDLDSVVSSISYAYFAHLKNEPVLPLLSFTRGELNARKDVALVLDRLDINKDSLLYADDLKKLDPEGIILVDHNKPSDILSSFPIVGIIDHHQDEKLFFEADPRIVQTAGSCSSLVAQYWMNQGIQLDKDVVKLLLAPLVIDTRNLTSRVEKVDVEASKQYAEYVDPQFTSQWFHQIQDAKFDITGLTAEEILAKDYKLFEFGVGSDEIPKLVGISSIVKPLSWLKKEYGLENELHKYLKDHELDILVVMTAFEDDGFKREIGFVTSDEANQIILDLALKSLQTELDLHPIDRFTYSQLNTAASRKQVAPAIQRALERL